MSTFPIFAAIAVSGQIKSAGNVVDTGGTVYGILYFLFMSAVILGAAYFATKYLARKGLNPAKNKNLKVIETVPLGIDKSLLLVKVGEQYLLLGSTQKNISLLSAIEQEKLTITNTAEVYSSTEGEGIETYMDTVREVQGKHGMSSVKHNLNKLKSIVRGNRIDV